MLTLKQNWKVLMSTIRLYDGVQWHGLYDMLFNIILYVGRQYTTFACPAENLGRNIRMSHGL